MVVVRYAAAGDPHLTSPKSRFVGETPIPVVPLPVTGVVGGCNAHIGVPAATVVVIVSLYGCTFVGLKVTCVATGWLAFSVNDGVTVKNVLPTANETVAGALPVFVTLNCDDAVFPIATPPKESVWPNWFDLMTAP